jgi:hypothetical protein
MELKQQAIHSLSVEDASFRNFVDLATTQLLSMLLSETG